MSLKVFDASRQHAIQKDLVHGLPVSRLRGAIIVVDDRSVPEFSGEGCADDAPESPGYGRAVDTRAGRHGPCHAAAVDIGKWRRELHITPIAKELDVRVAYELALGRGDSGRGKDYRDHMKQQARGLDALAPHARSPLEAVEVTKKSTALYSMSCSAAA